MRSTVTASAATHATRSPGSTFTSCVSSTMNATAVNGERIVPPISAPMPSAAQSPGSPVGIQCASRAPSAPPMMRSRASTPPDVPEPRATAQITALVTIKPTSATPTSCPGEEVVDGVVADAERTRVEQTAESDHGAAQEGPPHPVHRDLAKQVLARIHEPREQPRSEGGGDPEREHGAGCPARHEDRPRGADRPAGPDGNGGGQRLEHGNPGGHAALPDEDRLERLRDAVAPDPLGAVPRHESDDEASDDGH